MRQSKDDAAIKTMVLGAIDRGRGEDGEVTFLELRIRFERWIRDGITLDGPAHINCRYAGF